MVIISDIKQIERPNFYIFLCQFCRTSFAAGTGKRIREALSSALAPAMAYKGIHKVKLKNALNEKRKKLRGFSFSINMADFEVFRRTKQLISNLFFLKSGVLYKFGTFVLSFPLTFRQFLFFLQIPKS